MRVAPAWACQPLTQEATTFSPFARALTRITSLSSMPTQRHSSNPTPTLFSAMKLDYEVVQAYFSFFNPKPNDFPGAKTLLQTFLDGQERDLTAFVDLILAQTTVAFIVKIEDDDDEGLFALVTALNLYRYKPLALSLALATSITHFCDDLHAVLGCRRSNDDDSSSFISHHLLESSTVFAYHLVSSLSISSFVAKLLYTGTFADSRTCFYARDLDFHELNRRWGTKSETLRHTRNNPSRPPPPTVLPPRRTPTPRAMFPLTTLGRSNWPHSNLRVSITS
ncbi:hypothetical protein JHK87_031429 [Glycine soja]|nr:hypothetical protein JHK87_031429 [Glycine soja]